MEMATSSTIVGAIYKVVKDLGTASIARVTEAIAVRGIKIARYAIPWTRLIYIRDLGESIAEMPFIYVDLPLDVMTSFADVDLATQTKDVLQTGEWNDSPGMGAFEVIKGHRKFLLVGQAGIGKTTLFRYAILNLLDRKKRNLILLPGEPKVLPVYIPLKALDVTKKFPILNYIRVSHPYFYGRRGLRRLIRLAKKKRLMLFLDGYDEVPTAAGLPHIKEELNFLFSQSIPATERLLTYDEYMPFYRAFIGNRVGISSRKEFLIGNPIAVPNNASVLISMGLWESRATLVGHIFDRYRNSVGRFYKEKLSEELFMKQLSVPTDGILERLSHNPLFLTVMCYVYVSGVRDRRSTDDLFRLNEFDLIDKCIDLLLSDLDGEKVRGLQEIERRKFSERRSAYLDEKRKYLGELAAAAIFDGQGVFSYEYLIEHAREFFLTHPGSKNEEIRKGLLEGSSTNNVVLQIIFSGILVLQPGNKRMFDFPHRRFREALAVKHLDNEAGQAKVISRLSDPLLHEFILIYAVETHRVRPIAGALVREIEGGKNPYKSAELLLQFLRKETDADWQSEIVWDLILSLSRDNRGKALPVGLLRYLRPHFAHQKNLDELSRQAGAESDRSLAALVSMPLKHLSRPFALSELEDAFTAFKEPVGMAGALLGNTSFNAEGLDKLLKRFWPERNLAKVDPYGARELVGVIDSQISGSRRLTAKQTIDKYFELGRVKNTDQKKGGELEVELKNIAVSESGAPLTEDSVSHHNSVFYWI